MHFYVLNKYTDMKSTWLLCFYAFIAQKFIHNNKLFPARKCQKHFAHAQLTVSVINISGMVAISVHFFLYIGPNLTRKLPHRNEITQRI